MAIAVVVLTNGQQLITDLREIREPKEDGSPNPEGELLAFLFVAPLVLSYNDYDEETEKYKINYERWVPFSKETQFRVPLDKVTALGSPLDAVTESYIKQVYPNGLPEELK
jgi:hypothetical protein